MRHPHPSARRRAVIALAVGLAVGGVVAVIGPWQVAVLVGWVAAALVTILWAALEVRAHDAEATGELAAREDNSRVAAEALLLGASLVSLAGVGFGLVKAAHLKGMAQAGMTALTVLTVVLSWAVIQCVYTFRYAHLYYSGGKGIDFNYGDELPDYWDFLHLALTIGMTYQVADTDLRTKPIRRAVTSHALLSYLFGVVIVAMLINAVAGLLNR